MFARVLNLVALIAVVIAIPLSHAALSKKTAKKKGKGPAPKVDVCHYPDDSDVGHVINVSEHALAAHLSKHGDCTDYSIDDTTGACICPTCEERCEAAFQECIAEGGDQAECEAARAECVAACAPTCEDECRAEFDECLAAGGTTADCEAALSECLTACDTGG